MTTRRVTVFGGSGFIGRHLIKRLAAKGCVVRVVVRDSEAAAFLKPLGEPGQIVIRQVNIADQKQVEAVVSGSGEVINLIGILYEHGQHTFEQLHVEVPRRLAKLCSAVNIKCFVHVSALGASETSRARYTRSKAMGERVVHNNFSEAIIFRPSVIFGLEDCFFNRFATLARLSPVLPIFTNNVTTKSNGTSFQPVYVGDVADALTQALDNKACRGQIYELGGPKIYSMRDILELVLRETGRHRLVVPMPFLVGRFVSYFLQYFPKPLLTPDQVTLLQESNILSGTLPGFDAFGIEPTAPEAVLSTYLDRYRRNSRFLRYEI